jgi:heterodisulfide reductase subunit B
MSLPYYPGCTLSTQAKSYDRSARGVAAALGLELEELSEWQCCGATFPLVTDDSMALIAPTRVLCQAQSSGTQLVTLCAICFHVLRRSQTMLEKDPEMLERINWFTEQGYRGEVHVSHLLGVLRDDVGWERVGGSVVHSLRGLRIAPFYGCLLLRPFNEIGLDDPEKPRILHDLLGTLGAESVDFPHYIECCGSYLTVKEPRISETLSREIVDSARKHGAQAMVTACPLCEFNLSYPQRDTGTGLAGDELPVLYFTQLMAIALGLPEEVWGLDDPYVESRPLLHALE